MKTSGGTALFLTDASSHRAVRGEERPGALISRVQYWAKSEVSHTPKYFIV